MGIISFPEYLLMEGRSTSIELTPAAEIGASFPKYFLMIGVPRSAIISRKILVNSAIVPNSVASCSPIEGLFELGNKDRRERIVCESASHCHTVEHAPLAQ